MANITRISTICKQRSPSKTSFVLSRGSFQKRFAFLFERVKTFSKCESQILSIFLFHLLLLSQIFTPVFITDDGIKCSKAKMSFCVNFFCWRNWCEEKFKKKEYSLATRNFISRGLMRIDGEFQCYMNRICKMKYILRSSWRFVVKCFNYFLFFILDEDLDKNGYQITLYENMFKK